VRKCRACVSGAEGRAGVGAVRAALGATYARATLSTICLCYLLLLLMPPFLMKYGARGPFGRTSGLHGLCASQGTQQAGRSPGMCRLDPTPPSGYRRVLSSANM